MSGDEKCSECQGTGQQTCPKCRGQQGEWVGSVWVPCSYCRGIGKVQCESPFHH